MTDKNPSSLRSALMMQNPDHVNIIVQFAYESIYYATKLNKISNLHKHTLQNKIFSCVRSSCLEHKMIW